MDRALGSEAPVDFTCELPKAVWIVALPARQVSAESLRKAGLPEDVALGLSERDPIQAELSAVEELEPDPPPPGFPNHRSRNFRVEHNVTKIEISALAVVSTKKFVMTVKRSAPTTVALVALSEQRE